MKTSYIGCFLVLAACTRTDEKATEQVGTTTVTSSSVPEEGDQRLIRRAETAIAADPALSSAARNVEVDAVEGAVVLHGSVGSFATKQAVAEVVERSTGRSPLDKLVVSSFDRADPAVDDTLAFKLQRAMLNDAVVSREADTVTIDVVRGAVTLRGTTSTPATHTRVQALVEKVPGVDTVRNELVVQREQ